MIGPLAHPEIKPPIGELVAGTVTTRESSLLYIFAFGGWWWCIGFVNPIGDWNAGRRGIEETGWDEICSTCGWAGVANYSVPYLYTYHEVRSSKSKHRKLDTVFDIWYHDVALLFQAKGNNKVDIIGNSNSISAAPPTPKYTALMQFNLSFFSYSFSFLHPPPYSRPNYASPGTATRSGTSGLTSVTTLSKSSTTFCPCLSPADLMAFTCSSASALASSSAFLLPEVCCCVDGLVLNCLLGGWMVEN